MNFEKLFFIALIAFVYSLVLGTNARKNNLILQIKIKSDSVSVSDSVSNFVSDGKIKYTTDLHHLNNYDLQNIYTVIGSSTENKLIGLFLLAIFFLFFYEHN